MQPQTTPAASTHQGPLPLDLQRDLALVVLSILGPKGAGLPRDRAFWELSDRTLSRLRELGLDRDTIQHSQAFSLIDTP